MRVAFVAMETVNHRDTAGNRRLERLARHFVDAGHDVTIYCVGWWESDGPVFEPEDITYRAVTQRPATRSFCARLPFVLASDEPDVIHAKPTPAGTVLAARVGGALAGAPLAVEWFGDDTPERSAIARRAVTTPARTVTPSEMVRTAVRERGASATQATVIPESIAFDLVREADPADEVDVAFAHPLDGSDNLDTLLLGLAELRTKDWSATVIGDGPYREDRERGAADLRIDDRVNFVGACERERRVRIYKGAHVFVQTASREYFASELLWALACGCVGVVEYQAESSAHELIEHHDRSFRVTSTQGMADAIADSAEFERLTIDESLSTYDHGAIRGAYEDCYAELIEDHGWFG